MIPEHLAAANHNYAAILDPQNNSVVINGDEKLEIIPLGGGREVGRSCILVRFKGKLIMLDCGIHPASNDLSALPFFDLVEPKDIDVVLITQ